MTYRDELEAARARAQDAERELARVEASPEARQLVELRARLADCERQHREQAARHRSVSEELAAAQVEARPRSPNRRRPERRRRAAPRIGDRGHLAYRVDDWIYTCYLVIFWAFGVGFLLLVVGGIVKKC